MAGFNRFPEIAQQLHSQAGQVVRKTAFVIEGGAKTRAPVDTGFLKNSIYASTSEGSDYGGASGGKMLEEVKPANDQEAIIGVGAEYGEYVENGTVHMAAQPYLTPAAEAARPGFIAAMKQINFKA